MQVGTDFMASISPKTICTLPVVNNLIGLSNFQPIIICLTPVRHKLTQNSHLIGPQQPQASQGNQVLTLPQTWSLPVMLVRLYVGNLHVVC